MNEYLVTNKVYIKSNNNSNLIINRYFYSLIFYIVLSIIIYLILKAPVLPLIKSISMSFIITSILGYIINLFYKDNKFINIYKQDNLHTISLIIGIIGVNTNILILTIAIFLTVIINKLNKNISLSSSLYAIIIILIYKYINNDLYILDMSNIELSKNLINYVDSILSLIIFTYLFYKKSIKYNIFIYYVITIFLIMLGVGILTGMHIILPFVVITSNNLIFLNVYTLTDYMNTPTINETGRVYGIILGIITSILSFIIYPLSVVIPLILGPYILTNYLDNNSYKFKYKIKSQK